MTTTTILPTNPTEWHRRPREFTGPCPICGFPLLRGEHRATRPDESLSATWLVRRKSPRGWQMTPVFRDAALQTAAVETARDEPESATEQGAKEASLPPSIRVVEQIQKATAMLARGKSMRSVAEALQTSERSVMYLRANHRDLWNVTFKAAVANVVTAVRRQAGTDAVLADPDKYLQLATAADKWSAENERELFPTNGVDLSLSGFYRAYYVPNCLSDAHPETKRQYEIVLNLWRRITGDPPLRLITNTVLCKFRDTLLGMKGKGGRPYSKNTVRSKLTQLQAILDAAGPPGPRRRDAAGLLSVVPSCKPPRAELEIPRIVKMEWLESVYDAAQLMDCPEGFGIPTALWWRALLSVALNTALRHGTLFKLRWEWIDTEARRLLIPASAMKARRPHLVPLNADVLKHLASIRDDGTSDVVFPWPYTRETFDKKLKLLQGLAGIPAGERFGLHAIRRTAATLLWRNCPEAAQIILGHRSSLITLRHYIEPAAATSGAMERLATPWVNAAEKVAAVPASTPLPRPERAPEDNAAA
jgi:integrase